MRFWFDFVTLLSKYVPVHEMETLHIIRPGFGFTSYEMAALWTYKPWFRMYLVWDGSINHSEFFLPEIHPNLETQVSLRCAWYLYDAHQCMLSLWWSVPYIQHTTKSMCQCAPMTDASYDKAMPCNVTVLAGPSSRMPWNAQSESAP